MAKLILLIIGCCIICNCIAQVDSGKINFQEIAKPAMKVFPNPAKNKIELQLQGFESGNVFVNTLDLKGKIVNRCERMMIKGDETIVMFMNIDPGIYIIAVEQKNKSVRKKLMVL